MVDVLTTLDRYSPALSTKGRFLPSFQNTGASLLPLSNAHAKEK